MSKNEFAVKLTVGAVTIELGIEEARNAFCGLEDRESRMEIFAELAKSPSHPVRADVAGKEQISKETVDLLAGDSVVDVLKNLVRSYGARSHLNDEQLAGFVAKDAELALEIASQFDQYSGANTLKLAELLAQHADPTVRLRLADNSSTPKAVLKALSRDTDMGVATAAKSSLR